MFLGFLQSQKGEEINACMALIYGLAYGYIAVNEVEGD